MRFQDIRGTQHKCLNHIIHAAYAVTYEYINCSMNSYKFEFKAIHRFKQILLEIIWTDFKIQSKDEYSLIKFQNYWRELRFLYQISGYSIEIRIPSY